MARNPQRLEEFYSELKEIHKRTFSDWRFFQFMINFLGWVMYEKKNDGFYYEENKALELLREYENLYRGNSDGTQL